MAVTGVKRICMESKDLLISYHVYFCKKNSTHFLQRYMYKVKYIMRDYIRELL
jgi:hypothetical protein